MTFSLRNLFIGLIVFFLIVGSVFVFISAQVFYQNLQRVVTQEKTTVVASTAHFIFDAQKTATGTSATSAGLPFSTDSIRRVLTIGAQERGVQFFRLVDTDTREIVASSNPEEEGDEADRLPEMQRGMVSRGVFATNGTTLVDFTYQDADNLALWLAVEQVFFSGPTLTVTIQESFLILAMIGLIAVVFYITEHYFILDPLRRLQSSLAEIGEGNLEARLPEGPPNEFGSVYNSFNAMAESVQAARERDKLVSRMKSEFVSTAAHQLRTPVSGIRWAFEGLERGDFGDVSEKQKDIVERGLRKSQELANIIDTLLHTASIEEGRFDFSFSEVLLQDEMKDIVQTLRHQAENRGLSLQLDAEAMRNLPPVTADREKIRWVLQNIIDNAVRYTEEGRITITAEVREDGIVVSVADTGIGIPEEEQQRLFEKFYRGARAKRLQNEGNGLGLYIAKSIIETHGGSIWINSVPDEGTTASFFLPFEPPANGVIDEDDNQKKDV